MNADMQAAIEASYLELLRDFQAHLDARPYLLGTRPSIADFALLGPLYAHLYRDPRSGQILRERAPRVADWVERMKLRNLVPVASPATIGWTRPCCRCCDACSTSRVPCSSARFGGSRRGRRSTMGRSCRAPSACTSFASAPRGPRAVHPFNVWRRQRDYHHYHGLDVGERARADDLLARVGGLDAIRTPIGRRVQRRENRLFVA